MYHLLYHLTTRLVPTVCVSRVFLKHIVINLSIFVMQMLCVYCDAEIENLCIIKAVVGRDSSVGIATRYWLDDPGIESRWEARFFAPVQIGPGGHPASCTMGTALFP